MLASVAIVDCIVGLQLTHTLDETEYGIEVIFRQFIYSTQMNKIFQNTVGAMTDLSLQTVKLSEAAY